MNSIAIIGAGKFAYSFTSALQNARFNLKCIISRDRNSAEDLARSGGVILYSDRIIDMPADIDVVFITVPDSEIENVAVRLTELELVFRGKIFVHCSGALDSSLLEPLSAKGASTASFHIMQTFPSKRLVDISGCHTSIETLEEKSFALLYDLACKLNLKPFRLNKEQKTAYHLAGVFACNFLTGNLFTASEVFPDSISVYELLESIINSTLNNIKLMGAEQALSGPIDRGDYETIKKHISILKDKDHLISYIAQSYILLRTAEKKYGGLSESHKKIKTFLDDCLKHSFM